MALDVANVADAQDSAVAAVNNVRLKKVFHKHEKKMTWQKNKNIKHIQNQYNVSFYERIIFIS